MKNEEVELINCKDVLRCVENLEQPSRADIAKHLGLSRTTSSYNINKLMELALVKECESSLSKRGRPGKPIVLNDEKWYALGVCFANSSLYFTVVDLNGMIIDKKSVKIEPLTFDKFYKVLTKNLKYFLDKYPDNILPAIGVGSPGVIDPKTGTIVKAVDLGWYNIPLKQLLKEEFNLPIFINNRYRTMGLAEAKQGLGKGYDNLIFIGIGSGFGTAFFLDGKLVLSTNIHTGGIGHIVVDPHGPYCRCGKQGCLYTLGSLAVLEETAKTLLNLPHEKSFLDDKNDISMVNIMNAANKGDSLARECVIKVADPLCVVIEDLINIINPERIIIGGPMGIYGEFYCNYVSNKIADYYNTTDISIVQTQIDYFGGAVGAAYQVLENKLELVLNKEID